MSMIDNYARKLKACFLIKVNGSGLGGHYRSLRATVEALSTKVDCTIVNLGVHNSPVLEGLTAPLYRVPFTGTQLLSAAWRLSAIVKRFRPDVVVSFDDTSLFFARLMRIRHKLPVVHTKCGGPNSRRYSPTADAMILYSPENREFFESRRRLARTPLHLIPNRVKAFDCNSGKVQALRGHLREGIPCFVRISRICDFYEESLIQSITLIKELNVRGHACQLAIVGNVQSQDSLRRVREHCGEHVRLFTDDYFTRNAIEILDAAEMVIGTGRGFMEAASRGKVMLSPLKDQRLPLLVTDENFHEVFRTNFSERGSVRDYSEEANLGNLIRAMEDSDYRKSLGRQSTAWFHRYFNAESMVDSYEEILRSTRRDRRMHPIALMLNGYLAVSAGLKAARLEGASLRTPNQSR